uniref:DH domain-containing protein n=1 Tax=Magallana gigas TaxID=29159 RepID=K1RID6_MAGGI
MTIMKKSVDEKEKPLLEDTLRSWDQKSSQIGSLFNSKLWTVYEEYCNNYHKTRQLLDEKYTSDDSFVDFCNLRRGSSAYSLDTLLHLPICCPIVEWRKQKKIRADYCPAEDLARA